MTDTKRLLFIINPISGGRRSIPLHKEVGAIVHTIPFADVVTTEYAGHATELAKKATTKGYDIVVAVGGDGTVNEVASALVETGTALGIVPLGSGNGLARHLGISRRPREAVNLILESKPITIDSATINGTPFFCTAGIGFDAQVAADYANAGTRGLITYTKEAIKDWKSNNPAEYILETEEGVLHTKALLITVGNANQWGNDFFITPQASLQDGMLNITVVKPTTIKSNAKMVWQLRHKTLANNPDVICISSSSIKISCPTSTIITAHYDGEVSTLSNIINIECHMASLNIIPGKR